MTQGHPARTPDELRRAMDDLFRKVLADGERRRAAYPPGPPPWTPDASDIDEDDDLELDRIWEEARPMRKIADLREQLIINDTSPVAADLDAVLAARGLHLDPSAPGTAAIRRDAMHVHIQARTIDAEREEGDYSTNALAPTLPPHLAAIAPPVPALGPVPWGPQGPAPLLSEEFDAFCKAMAGNAWRDDHAADARAAWKLWSELMDDCRLDEIGRKPWEFRERLSRLPKLHGKSVFKGLTAPTAITRADAIERGKFDPSKIPRCLSSGPRSSASRKRPEQTWRFLHRALQLAARRQARLRQPLHRHAPQEARDQARRAPDADEPHGRGSGQALRMIVVRWRVNVEPALVLSLFSVPSRTQSASTLPRTDQRSHRHQSALP